MIERMRSYLPWYGVDETGDHTSDREILNVFRYSEESMMATREIADELPITPEWTHKRLKRLKEDERLEFRKFAGEGGSQESGGIDVWRLSSSETRTPVPEGPFDIGWWLFQLSKLRSATFRAGGVLMMAGGLLLIPIFFLISSSETNVFIFHQTMYIAGAMAAALTAGIFFILGGIESLLALGIKRYFLPDE